MILTKGEVDCLNAVLWQIRSKAAKKSLPKHTIENLCDRAVLVLNKAKRKRNQITRLHFEIGDFEL